MVTYPTSPVLIDAFIVEFNTKIAALLPWLNNPLGKVQPVTKKIKGVRTQVPAMHEDNGEYTEVYPDDKKVNFSWFSLSNEEPIGRAKFKVSADFNLFLDLNAIYPLVTASRDLENVKSEVFAALESITLLAGAIRINSISESYSDVYSGYAIPELQDKYFMQPYAGLSFGLDLYIKNTNSICT